METIFRGLGAFIAASLMYGVMCYIFMLLWNNCFVGAVDGVREISYARALGIVALFGLLITAVLVLFSLFTFNPSSPSQE